VHAFSRVFRRDFFARGRTRAPWRLRARCSYAPEAFGAGFAEQFFEREFEAPGEAPTANNALQNRGEYS
jgi:hypothetical protein